MIEARKSNYKLVERRRERRRNEEIAVVEKLAQNRLLAFCRAHAANERRLRCVGAVGGDECGRRFGLCLVLLLLLLICLCIAANALLIGVDDGHAADGAFYELEDAKNIRRRVRILAENPECRTENVRIANAWKNFL